MLPADGIPHNAAGCGHQFSCGSFCSEAFPPLVLSGEGVLPSSAMTDMYEGVADASAFSDVYDWFFSGSLPAAVVEASVMTGAFAVS